MKEVVYYTKSELYESIKGYEEETHVYKTSKDRYTELFGMSSLLRRFPSDRYELVEVEYENLYKM